MSAAKRHFVITIQVLLEISLKHGRWPIQIQKMTMQDPRSDDCRPVCSESMAVRDTRARMASRAMLLLRGVRGLDGVKTAIVLILSDPFRILLSQAAATTSEEATWFKVATAKLEKSLSSETRSRCSHGSRRPIKVPVCFELVDGYTPHHPIRKPARRVRLWDCFVVTANIG